MKTVDDAALEANFASVKGTVGCDEVAEIEVELRSEGKHLRGACPLPDHRGSSRSFYCYMADNGRYERWFCHRCNEGGDVVDLYGKMNHLSHNAVWAMQALAERFNLSLWQPRDLMSDEQLAVRRARLKAEKRIERVLTELAFERMIMPIIRGIEDDEERARQLEDSLKAAGLWEGK